VLIAILGYGSQGDVRPFVALGRGLVAAGHRVRVVTDAGFRQMVEAAGLEHAPIEGDLRRRLAEERGLAGVTNDPVRLVRLMRRLGRELAPVWARDGLAGCEGADAVVSGGGAVFLAGSLAERLDLPMVQGWLQPVVPTAEFTTPVMRPLPVWGGPARWTHSLMQRLIWAGMAGPVGEMRRHLGLPEVTGSRAWAAVEQAPSFCAVSPALVPRPADWPARAALTGFLFLDDPDWRPDPGLEAFLEADVPPVYVGFGSMMQPDAATFTREVVQALRTTGCRAVVATGWGGLDRAVLEEARAAGAPLHPIEAAPHDRLLPMMAAAVHHGGAGTTAAVARAGLPSVVVPFLGDQPFWGDRLHRVGAAPPPLPARRLTADRLCAALDAVLDRPALRRAAETIGRAVRSEQGTAAAVAVVEAAVADPPCAGAMPHLP
jgi:UDP:flavonoid glycosyltransferase YjiC (YdhE family)